MATAPHSQKPPHELPPELAVRLHREAGAEHWPISVEAFSAVLMRSATKALGDRVRSPRDLEAYLTGLHLRDLALACACLESGEAGSDAAWEMIIREHRPGLYRAAEAMRPGGGQELADSLYGELFGVSARGEAKTSLLRYYHGRSSLGTWLRAVLAQRLVDTVRSERRFEPLAPDPGSDHQSDTLADPASEPSRSGVTGVAGAVRASGDSPTADADRLRWMPAVHAAMRSAIAGLSASDRLRLSLYYVDGLTLAEIGRTASEHEATVSRHLTRTRKALRLAVEEHLRTQAGLSAAEMAECLASAMSDAGELDLSALIHGPPSGSRIVGNRGG